MIREISLTEIYKVHQVYERLSPASKRTYRSIVFGIPRSPIWFIAQVFMINSYIPIGKIRLLTKLYKYILYVAVKRDDFLGFVSVTVQKPSTSYGPSARLAIAVDDSHQGKGIGSQLLLAIIARCRKERIRTIYLDVAEANHRGISLYEKNGFVPTSMSSERYEKIIRMELVL